MINFVCKWWQKEIHIWNGKNSRARPTVYYCHHIDMKSWYAQDGYEKWRKSRAWNVISRYSFSREMCRWGQNYFGHFPISKAALGVSFPPPWKKGQLCRNDDRVSMTWKHFLSTRRLPKSNMFFFLWYPWNPYTFSEFLSLTKWLPSSVSAGGIGKEDLKLHFHTM